jgi:hypothetical protein
MLMQPLLVYRRNLLTDPWGEDNAYRHRFGIDAVIDTETLYCHPE